jgi:putative ABC transport system substrate-binding protein
MNELGYLSGVNASIVFRFTEERDDLLAAAAHELARQQVDVIVASNSAATAAAMAATKTIPIVMVTSGDPLATGFIRSLARPGGNVTGLSSLVTEMSVKQLELLKAVSSRISRIAVFWNPNNQSNTIALPQVHVASKASNVELVPVEVRAPLDLDGAFDKVRQAKPDALLTLIDQVTIRQRERVAAFAASIRCPAMYALKNFVDVGGLMSYGVSFNYLHHRAATYVDRILKGSSPAELPVEQPTKIEFFINSRTAQALDLTIPRVVRARAEMI